jgi:hypothetical protein
MAGSVGMAKEGRAQRRARGCGSGRGAVRYFEQTPEPFETSCVKERLICAIEPIELDIRGIDVEEWTQEVTCGPEKGDRALRVTFVMWRFYRATTGVDLKPNHCPFMLLRGMRFVEYAGDWICDARHQCRRLGMRGTMAHVIPL